MIEEGIIEKFLQKVNQLEVITKTKSRDDILAEIDKLKQWLISDRSLQEHRLFFAFVQFLYSSYGDDYKNIGDYLDDIKRMTGYCDQKITMADIDGQKVKLIKYKVKSLSFAKCSQKVFTQVFEKLKDFALKKYGVKFDEWQENGL